MAIRRGIALPKRMLFAEPALSGLALTSGFAVYAITFMLGNPMPVVALLSGGGLLMLAIIAFAYDPDLSAVVKVELRYRLKFKRGVYWH